LPLRYCLSELAAVAVDKDEADSAFTTVSANGTANHTLNIATDSLASIYQIWKWVTRPQDLQEHRHRSILQAIGHKIETSAVPIHIWKVKSHIGIVGNEIADATAVGVAKGTLHEYERSNCTTSNSSSQCDTPTSSTDAEEKAADRGGRCIRDINEDDLFWRHCFDPSNDRANQYWPHYRDTISKPDKKQSKNDGSHQQMPQKRNKKEETLTVYRTLPNMAESLKSAMHKRHKLGLSNTSTVYFKSWQSQLHCIDDTHSHLFMTSSKVTPQQRKRVLQYRYGLLPTYKLLHRYKKVTNTTCPLCGGEDGGHHAVSSCPALSNVVTLRHNDAGTAILKAIHQGCKGRMLVTSDVGWRKRHEAPDLPLPKAATTRNIQAHNLPDSIPAHVKEALTKCSIPDAFMHNYDEEHDVHHYIIVEIKYCRDTDPLPQQSRASQQHHVLARDPCTACTESSCGTSDVDARGIRSALQSLH